MLASLSPFPMPMMSLGLFVFALGTTPYQEFKHTYNWRWPSNARVGAPPAYQFTGKDEEPIALSGLLLPELTGGDSALHLLKTMADQGKAWPLIEGTGTLYGFFVVEQLEITRRSFFSDGKAWQIEFTLNLKRIDENLKHLLGQFTDDLVGLAQLPEQLAADLPTTLPLP